MIHALIMDVDGTLTDGAIYIGKSGEMMKKFNVKDGYSIRHILPTRNIIPIIITGRTSDIVVNRCKELGINLLVQGSNDKIGDLINILDSEKIALSETAYIGDELNDLECMKLIVKNGGIVGCPADAVDEVKEIANYVCIEKGGEGAVREFINWIFKFNFSFQI